MGQFLTDFLKDRKFRVAIGGSLSMEFIEENGVPQGSVLSVTLFLVAMNGLYEKLPRGIYIFVYADDIVLASAGPTRKRTRNRLQSAVNRVGEWAESVGFRIAADKCAISHFCNENHQATGTPVTLNDTRIPYRKTLKIIGVTLDRHLTFKPHFARVKEECKNRSQLIKTISSRHNTGNRRTLLRVANSIITSKLTYGIEFSGTNMTDLVKILGPVYNKAIRNTSGLLPSTPATATCVEAGITTFDVVAKTVMMNRTIGFLEKTTGDNQSSLEHVKEMAMEILGEPIPKIDELQRITNRSWDSRGPTIDWGIRKLVKAGDPPEKTIPLFEQHCIEKYQNYRKVYTDGSKLDDRVGIGIASPEENRYHRLPKICSVFSAETAAILEATREAHTTQTATVIFSDSESVLKNIESGRSRHSWIQAIEEASTSNLRICWVPGHCGIPGNEEADQLANQGRNGNLLTNKAPSIDVKSWIRKTARDYFARTWDGNRNLALREIKNTVEPWTDRSNRREQIVLTRLRTGHTKFSHFSDTGAFIRNICDTCGTSKTAKHVLVVCPSLQELRDHYGLQGSMREILANDPARETIVILFLKEAGIFSEV